GPLGQSCSESPYARPGDKPLGRSARRGSGALSSAGSAAEVVAGSVGTGANEKPSALVPAAERTTPDPESALVIVSRPSTSGAASGPSCAFTRCTVRRASTAQVALVPDGKLAPDAHKLLLLVSTKAVLAR